MDEQMRETSRRMFLMLSGAVAAGAGALGPAGLGQATLEAAAMTETDRRNIEVVKGMSDAFKTADTAKIVAFMDDKVALRLNATKMESPAMVGKDHFIKTMTSFFAAYDQEMIVRDMFALAPLVVTCHHQLFTSKKDRVQTEDLYIGCFFVENGKIREWNDYAIIPFSAPRQKTTAGRAKFFHVG